MSGPIIEVFKCKGMNVHYPHSLHGWNWAKALQFCNAAIEGELEKAIHKAGGIRDSNFGDLQKIAWARSSRTDKGVCFSYSNLSQYFVLHDLFLAACWSLKIIYISGSFAGYDDIF